MIIEKKLYRIKVDGVSVFVDENGNMGRIDKIGRFRWLNQHDSKSNSTDNPYKRVTINGKSYYAHRIALGAYSGGIFPNL